MRLEGSCHCGSVTFRLESRTPYPYLRCYCSICRKTAGGGGYAINIMGLASTLKISGRKHIGVYRARIGKDERGKPVISEGRRHFCRECASALYLWDARWPRWVYPFASAIDTPLPKPPERVHVLLDSRAPWVEKPRAGKHDRCFAGYPDEAIIAWHRRQGLYG
jgi:hypothetical protein